MVSFEAVIYYLVLIDAVAGNLVSWFGGSWYKKNLKWIYKHLPNTKGWMFIYLLLVLWIGYGLMRLGII